MNISHREVLENGAKILQPFLTLHGFTFQFIQDGIGSGGAFAIGEFKKGNHYRLELHSRYSLCLVRYHLGQVNVSHQYYMAALGVRDQCQYPGFTDDHLDAFRYLLHDLELFAGDFLEGSGAILAKAAESEAEAIAEGQPELMAGYVGDTRLRAEARELFHRQRYDDVVQRLTAVRYPELLTDAERKMLEIAQKKIGR